MQFVIVRKNFANTYYSYITRSLVVPGVFFLLLLLGSVPYAAYQYAGGHPKASHPPQGGNSSTQVNGKADALTVRLEKLQNIVAENNRLGKELLTKSESEIHTSLSWDELIVQEQSGHGKKRSASSRRFARQTPLAGTTHVPLPSLLPNQSSLLAESNNDDELVEDMESLRCVAPRQTLPAGWPVRFGCISSKYGPRGRRMHKGIDIATSRGTDVLAVESGVVTRSGRMRGYGNIVEIRHGNTYITRYSHNTKNTVEVGELVTKGQVIGYAGATGRATGVHVHFEIRELGTPINPADYLASVNRVNSVKLTDDIQISSRK